MYVMVHRFFRAQFFKRSTQNAKCGKNDLCLSFFNKSKVLFELGMKEILGMKDAKVQFLCLYFAQDGFGISPSNRSA
jgi:hypothetical protein